MTLPATSGLPVASIVLAAGASRRMGRPKQLLQFRGRTLLRRIVEEALASSVSRVLVVVGAHSPAATAALTGLPVDIVENPDWPRGQGTSVGIGIRTLRERAPEISAAVFLLADQPLVTASCIDLLVTTHRRTGAPLVASRVEDRLEAPALFSFAFFDELSALEGEAGAREVLRRHAAHVTGIPLPGATVDVDTPDDYERLIALEQNESRS